MLPQVVQSVRSFWLKLFFDLIIFHAAVFISVILLSSHWVSIGKCFNITIGIELSLLFVLFLLRNSKPSEVPVKLFCDRKSVLSETVGGAEDDIHVVRSVKWEFVRKAGGGQDAPENTLAAIKKTKEYGVTGVVVDLRLTSDGVIVLCHDESVGRTTDGSGCIASMTYQQVAQLNAAAAKFETKNRVSFGHEPVPSLEDAIKLYLTSDLKMILDLKDTSNKVIDSLLVLFKKYPLLYERAAVCSFMPFVLYKIRKLDSKIMTGLRTRNNYLQWNFICPEDPSRWKWCMVIGDQVLSWSVYSWLWYFCGISFVLLYKDTISRQVLDYWEQRGVAVIVWTVNNPQEKNHMTNILRVPVITDMMGSEDEPIRKCFAERMSGKSTKVF